MVAQDNAKCQSAESGTPPCSTAHLREKHCDEHGQLLLRGADMRPIMFGILAAAVMATPVARGADIRVLPDARAVTIEGEIQPNDFEIFKEKTSRLNGQHIVGLQSYGGNIIAALQIGEFIRMRGWQTFVPKECHSACALIWLAGVKRAMNSTARIGFHAASVDGREIGSGNALVGAYLTRLGYSYGAVAFATTAAPDDIALLSPARAKSLGIEVIVEQPQQQAQTPPPTANLAVPQVAAPPAPPAAESTAKEQVEFLLSYLMANWNSGNVEGLAHIYSDNVLYYGKSTSKSDIIVDKLKFIERWPTRNYTIRQNSLTINCNGNDLEITSCTAQGLMDWDATNSSQRSVGTASFGYTFTGSWSRSGNQMLDLRIAAENSIVTARNITDISPKDLAQKYPRIAPEVPPQGYAARKIWDTYIQSTGRYIRRELQAGPNGSYRVIATDHDGAGGSNGGSTCTFNASGWSDCVGTGGNHYQLKPQSIRWFLNIAAGQEP
jgi:hypothetical protein